MPIPKLNKKGFLPEDIHTCTLEEIRTHFGSFKKSDRRVILCDKLFELVANAKATNLVEEIIVDGSFVTSKDKPSDIDLIVGLKESFVLNPNVELSFSDYNALSKKQLRKRYRFDVFVDNKGGPIYKKFLDFFQNVKDSDERKGVLRLRL